MTRIIREQVLTSTGIDFDGESFSRTEIVALFDRMTDNQPLVVRHDMSTEPIARSFNKQMKDLANGELAITVDIEVFDEAQFSQFGGMSIGLTRNIYDFGSGVPAAAVTLNTRQFDVEAAGKQLAELVDGRFSFQVVERVEKAAVIVAAIIVVVGFVVTKMFESFFAEAGKDLYTYVKQLRRRDSPSAPVEVHFHLHLHQSSKTPVVVLAVDQRVSPQDLTHLDAGPIRDAIVAAGGEDNLQRVVGSIGPGGEVKVSYLVDSQGRPI